MVPLNWAGRPYQIPVPVDCKQPPSGAPVGLRKTGGRAGAGAGCDSNAPSTTAPAPSRNGEARTMKSSRSIAQILVLLLALGVWTGFSPSAAAQQAGTPGVHYQEGEEFAPALARQILGQRIAAASSQIRPRGLAAQSFGTGGISAPANAEVIELARALCATTRT